MENNAYIFEEGVIINIEATRFGNLKPNGCVLFVTVENQDGNIVNFIISPSTYILDFITLREGMSAKFYHLANVPVPLIYPPQYNAVVVVPDMGNRRFVSVGYFNENLVNDEVTLQLKLDNSVDILTTNNQVFLGSPTNHNLLVVYETSTRSIPAQTTPIKIIVLCERNKE